MATSNLTTTSSTVDSSLPAGTNTTSTFFSPSTTSRPTTTSTSDAGRPSDAWTTSTITFVTVVYSTPTTRRLETVVHISGASSSDSPSFRPLSTVGPLKQPTTATVTEETPKSETTTSDGSSSASKSQRRPSVPVLVVIGLVVASFIAGIFFLVCRRRRRRLRQNEVDISKRPESCASFLDDPFVCVAHNLAPAMRPAKDEDRRGRTHPVLDSTTTSNRVGNGGFISNSHPHKFRSLNTDSGTTISNQHGTQRSSPCLPTTYPSILEQGEMIGGEGRLLERDATEQNLDETRSLKQISCPPPPPRPPRSPRRKSKRSARNSPDSVSTAHSSSTPLLCRPSPESSL